jgi:hypothetical protein
MELMLSRSEFIQLARQNASVMVVGLTPDEHRSFFDGHTCVNSFRSGIVFYDGPEHDYTRPTVFVGPSVEPMCEPLGFDKQWHAHAIGQHYYV